MATRAMYVCQRGIESKNTGKSSLLKRGFLAYGLESRGLNPRCRQPVKSSAKNSRPNGLTFLPIESVAAHFARQLSLALHEVPAGQQRHTSNRSWAYVPAASQWSEGA